MKDDMLQMIKERLMDELIDKMSDADPRMKPSKGLGVEVQAPDKEHLAEGLEHAQDLLKEAPAHAESDPEDDESRLAELLGDDDDEDKY